jgi:hypothetical protein
MTVSINEAKFFREMLEGFAPEGLSTGTLSSLAQSIIQKFSEKKLDMQIPKDQFRILEQNDLSHKDRAQAALTLGILLTKSNDPKIFRNSNDVRNLRHCQEYYQRLLEELHVPPTAHAQLKTPQLKAELQSKKITPEQDRAIEKLPSRKSIASRLQSAHDISKGLSLAGKWAIGGSVGGIAFAGIAGIATALGFGVGFAIPPLGILCFVVAGIAASILLVMKAMVSKKDQEDIKMMWSLKQDLQKLEQIRDNKIFKIERDLLISEIQDPELKEDLMTLLRS